jgi:hypothetical protein
MRRATLVVAALMLAANAHAASGPSTFSIVAYDS